LLIANQLQSFRWSKIALCRIAGVAAACSVLVLHADYVIANMGRDAAQRLIVPRVAQGHRIWLASQWGFQWYALQTGASNMYQGDVPISGDYLARGAMKG